MMRNKDFNNEKFHFPVLQGVYTSRVYSIAESERDIYAMCQYYENGEEGILIHHSLDRGEESVLRIKSRSGTAFRPVGAVTHTGTLHVFWSECNNERWHICGVRLENGHVQPLPDLHINDGALLAASAAAQPDGSVLLACERLSVGGRSAVCLYRLHNGQFDDLGKLSGTESFAGRPVIAVGGDGYSVVWDGYSEDGYDIYAYHRGVTQRLTHTSDWELAPSAVMDDKGVLYIAWLSNTDVERDGVVSKRNTVKAAVLDESLHALPDVVGLDIGLLPGKRYFGYSGTRRIPQIKRFTDGRVGVLWESQRDEREIWNDLENGILCLSIFSGTKWSKPLAVHNGYCCFRTSSRQTEPGVISFVCRGERSERDNLHVMRVSEGLTTPAELPCYPEFEQWRAATLPTAQARAAKGKDGLLWGDFHCHGIYSPDAEGWPDELFFYARDKALLDFSGITENDFYPENVFFASNLRYIELMASVIAEEGRFLPFAGFEWTFHEKDGPSDEGRWNHRSVVFLERGQPIARRGEQSGQGEAAFLKTMGPSRSFWHAHHAAWSLMDEAHEPNVEIVSAWAKNIDLCSTVDAVLKSGRAVGFMGSSDNHRYIPGYGGALSAVRCPQCTYQALETALRERSVYATAGNRAALSFSVNDVSMGGRLCVQEGAPLRLRLSCDSLVPIARIELICDGKTLRVYPGLGAGETLCDTFEYKCYAYCRVKVLLQGESREFPHNIALAEGPEIWSGPILLCRSN